MRTIYRVTLSADERAALETLIRKGTGAAQRLARARILRKADHGQDGPAWPDGQGADARGVAPRAVAHVRRRVVEGGAGGALARKPHARPSKARLLGGRAQARLVALACSAPPAGAEHWTLPLLADRLIELRVVGAIAADTVGRALERTRSRRGRSSRG